MKYLEALKQSGKEEKKSILPDTENKMQEGTRSDQRSAPHETRRRNNLDPKDPQSLISGTHQQNQHTDKVSALATELGVDLTKVKGTGPRGTVTEKDVRDAHEQKDK